MKISMWMIAQRLERYQPKCAIVDGQNRISGFRFISGEGKPEFDPEYLYLSLDSDTESAVLCNGPDMMMLQGRDINEILNDLLGVFEFYNGWETALWEAASRKSFQQIIDLGESVLHNPMILADRDGAILAMTGVYCDEDINEFWVECRETGCIPTAIAGAPTRTPDGRIAPWTATPQIFRMPDGTQTIGCFLEDRGTILGGLSLWEYRSGISPSDVGVIQVICEVLRSAFEEAVSPAPTRSSEAIIGDLLSGVQIEEPLLSRLELRCRRPWQLLVIGNPFRDDPVWKRNLLKKLQREAASCIPLIYGDHVVMLLSEADGRELIGRLLREKDRSVYTAVLSQPFDDLHLLAERYAQTRFAMEQIGDRPGVYDGHRFGLDYLLLQLSGQSQRRSLTHPAVKKLKDYDEAHGTELLESLYQYLLHERSLQKGAQAMYVHKNSFLYRIQKIRALTGLDLDDPTERLYLLLSCRMEWQ